MIQDFAGAGGGADKFPQEEILVNTILQKIDNLVEATYPNIAKYNALGKKLDEKNQLISDLKKRFQELDNEYFEIDDGNKQNLPEDTKKTIKENLRVDKMRVFELERKTETEIKLIKSEMEGMRQNVDAELARIKQENKE